MVRDARTTVIESVTRAMSESYGRRESQQRKPALVFLANSSAGLGGKQTRRPHAHSPAQGGSLNHAKTDRRRKRPERLCEDHDDKLNTRPSINGNLRHQSSATVNLASTQWLVGLNLSRGHQFLVCFRHWQLHSLPDERTFFH